MLHDSLHRWLVRGALFLALITAPVLAADKSDDAKGSAPEKITDKNGTKLFKLTGEHPGTKETITCLVDTNDAADMEQWGIDAAKYAIKWYPEIEKTLAS